MSILIGLLIICIAIFPKINIISVGTGSAGIRIEDFLIAIICMIFFGFSKYKKNENNKNYVLKKLNEYFLIYFTFSFISTMYGIYKSYVTPLIGFLFLFRKLEYYLVFFAGYYYGKIKPDTNRKFMNLIVFFHFIMCLLQLFGLVGSFNRGEMLSTLTQGRVSSTFNGAYELSAFLLIILPYYINSLLKDKKYKISNILNIIFITFCIIESMSRTSLIIEIIIFFLMIFKSGVLQNKKNVQKLIISVVFLILPLLVFTLPKFDFSRFSDLNINKTIYIIKYTWKNKNFNRYIKTGSWYGNSIFSLNQIDSMGYDGSLYQRLSHWMQLLDGWKSSPLIGVGVSVSGNSADGNYVKILVETGILGLVTWIMLLKYILILLKKKENWLIYSYFTILLGAVFIDLFDSSKVIMTFWLLLGIYLRRIFENDKECCNCE